MVIDCLNPCFNGRYSQSYESYDVSYETYSLNPCFNGRYSQSAAIPMIAAGLSSLNPCFNGRYSQSISWITVVGCSGES